MNTRLRRLRLALVVVVLLAAMSYPTIQFVRWLPWRTHVAISGKIVDADTGEAISDARVIVNLVRNGFPYPSTMGYGTTTNERGEFSLDTTSPRAFNDLSVEACSPDNKYIVVPYGKGTFSLLDGPVTLRVSPLSAKYDEAKNLHYESFRGKYDYNQWNPMTFIGQSW